MAARTVFIPSSGNLIEAICEADELWRAVESRRQYFASIWDPMRYIVREMLRPRLIVFDVCEWRGKYYFAQKFNRANLGRIDCKLKDDCIYQFKYPWMYRTDTIDGPFWYCDFYYGLLYSDGTDHGPYPCSWPGVEATLHMVKLGYEDEFAKIKRNEAYGKHMGYFQFHRYPDSLPPLEEF